MRDFLTSHAVNNVWCAPDQDDQVVFAPTRLTGPRGAVGTAKVLWERLALPDPISTYHVYQIGQVAPGLLGLLPDPGIWRLAAEHMKNEALMCDIYTIDGIQLPRIETYFLVNRDKNVLVAIKDQKPLIDLSQDGVQIFIRLYSNAFFYSDRETDTGLMVDIYGQRVANQDQTLALQHKFQSLQAKPGLVSAYVNGMLVDAFNPFVVPMGQVVEIVYDASVKRVVEFPVKDLQTFNSLLDNKRKYLLHYPGLAEQTIDYIDDIDVYLINRKVAGPVPAFKGVYYHKNAPDALRMVTHKDYAIAVPYIEGYAQQVPGWGTSDDLTVRLHIRRAGLERPLVNEVSRITDLYRLPDERIVKAMLGVDASMPQWQAVNLENSPYAKLMRLPDPAQITADLVQQAYGYYAIGKLLGDGPVPVLNSGGVKYISVPAGLQNGATMFEYDSSGLLLGYSVHPVGSIYQAKNSACAWIEGISGIGSDYLSTAHNVNNQTLDPNVSYRFYKCPLVDGVPTGNWTDCTDQDSSYMVVDGKVVWQIDLNQWATMVRDDANFLTYTYTMTPQDGLFTFSITSTELWGSSRINGVMTIPPGHIALYLNGHALIEGLDYRIQWPQVCIMNKTFLKYNEDGSLAAQKVVVVGTGFCNDQFERTTAPDVGFVAYDVISRNNFFNVRDDKALRITVNGGVYPRGLLKFSEDYPSTGMTSIANGVPYAIEEVVVPVRDFASRDTYALRASDELIDAAVENYLTQYLKDTDQGNPDTIPDVYPIYSPFCAKILYDLLDGVIDITSWQGQYSDMDVKNALVGYKDLLQYEPTYLPLDFDHVIVHAHDRQTVIPLTVYQYNFLKRAVKVYLNDKVDLSHSVSIISTYI